jgi:hypothetical protein
MEIDIFEDLLEWTETIVMNPVHESVVCQRVFRRPGIEWSLDIGENLDELGVEDDALEDTRMILDGFDWWVKPSLLTHEAFREVGHF